MKTYEDFGLSAVRVAHYFRPENVNVYRVAFGNVIKDEFARILSYELLPKEIQMKLAWLNAKDSVSVSPVPEFVDVGYMWASDDYHKEYWIYVHPDTVSDLRGLTNSHSLQVEAV